MFCPWHWHRGACCGTVLLHGSSVDAAFVSASRTKAHDTRRGRHTSIGPFSRLAGGQCRSGLPCLPRQEASSTLHVAVELRHPAPGYVAVSPPGGSHGGMYVGWRSLTCPSLCLVCDGLPACVGRFLFHPLFKDATTLPAGTCLGRSRSKSCYSYAVWSSGGAPERSSHGPPEHAARMCCLKRKAVGRNVPTPGA